MNRPRPPEALTRRDRVYVADMSAEPCNLCGGRVRVELETLDPEIAGGLPPEQVTVRVCTNPDCRSNTGDLVIGEGV